MHYTYNTKNTCSKKIECDINNGIVTNLSFTGGCPGNLKILSKILEGWKIEKIISTCKGNICGFRNTSCVDQLAIFLEEKEEKEKQKA